MHRNILGGSFLSRYGLVKYNHAYFTKKRVTLPRDSKSLDMYLLRYNAKLLFLALNRWRNSFDSSSSTPLNGVLGLFVALCYDCQITDKSIEYCLKRAKIEGSEFLTITLPLLDKALLKGLGSGFFQCPSSFKRLSIRKSEGNNEPSSLPVLFYDLFRQVFDDSGMLLEEASPEAVRCLRQLTGFAYKAELPYSGDAERRIISDFVTTDAELTAFTFDDKFCARMAHYASKIFTGYDPTDFVGRNGPGVTSDTELCSKFEAVIPPTDFNFENTDRYFFNENDQFERMDREPVWSHQALFQQPFRAKVLLVPKDSRGPRLISAEPALQQFLQQGVKDYFVSVLESHPLTKGSVNFTDQSINQSVAQIGSVDQSWSTLDLKSASDRVSNDLVQRLFQFDPVLLADLQGTRTSRTLLPDGRTVRMNKFAPMGSAMCFPMLATVVYLATFVCLELCGIPPKYIRDYVRVYGDDIAVHSKFSSVVVAALEHVGLSVNTDKSFFKSRFCESCGMDSFDGFDVTPIRLRQWIPNKTIQDQSVWTPTLLVSINKTAQQLQVLGYHVASQYLYTLLESFVGPLPFGYSHSSFLCRITPDNEDAWTLSLSRGASRHIVDLKRSKVRVPVLIPSENTTAIQSWGAHCLRTWPMLGQNMEIPHFGEFPDTGPSFSIEHAYADEDDFSKYPSSTWLPKKSFDGITEQSVDERSEARRRIWELNFG